MAIVHKTATSITIITKSRTIKIDTNKYKLKRKVRQRRTITTSDSNGEEEDIPTTIPTFTEQQQDQETREQEGNMVSITDFIPQCPPPYNICTGTSVEGGCCGDGGYGEEEVWTPLSYFNPLNAMTFYSGTAATVGGDFCYDQQQQQQQYQQGPPLVEDTGCCYCPQVPINTPSMYAAVPPPSPPLPPPFGLFLPPIMEEPECNFSAVPEGGEEEEQENEYDVAYCMPKFASAPAPNVDPLRTLMGTMPSPKLDRSFPAGVIGGHKGSGDGGGLKSAPPGLRIPARLRSFYRHGEPGVTWDGTGPNPFGPISPPRLPLPWRRKGGHKYGLGSKVLLDPDEEPECRDLDELLMSPGGGDGTVVMVPLFSGTGFGYSVLCPPRKGRTWTCCECSQVRNFADGNVCGKDCHRFCGGCIAYVERGREDEFIRWRDGKGLPEQDTMHEYGVVDTVQEIDDEPVTTVPDELTISTSYDEDDDKDSIYHDCMSSNSTTDDENGDEEEEEEDEEENDDVFSNVSQSPPDSKATSLHEHSDEEVDVTKPSYPSSDEAEPETEPEPEWLDDYTVQFRFDEENIVPAHHPKNLKELIEMQMRVHRSWRCCGGASNSTATSVDGDADDEGGNTSSRMMRRKWPLGIVGCGTTWRSRATGRCLNCGHRRCEVCDDATAAAV